MANAHTEQILLDGTRNAVVKLVGVLDTSDQASVTVIDPASFTPLPTQFRIDSVDFTVSDQLAVQLLWDATTPVVIEAFAGRGCQLVKDVGGLQNNGGAGKTGKILLKTTGWLSGTQTYSIIVKLVKQGVLS